MSSKSESSSLTHSQLFLYFSVRVFGSLCSLVCQICNADEGISLFAFVAAKRCKQTLETHKREEAFLQCLCENWASLGVSENRPPTLHPTPLPPSPC